MRKDKDMKQFSNRGNKKLLSPVTESEWFTFIIKNNWLKLIGLNLLTIVFMIPIVTFPAAICAMSYIIMLWRRSKRVVFWKDYFIEFRKSMWQRFVLMLLLTIAPLSLSIYPYILGFNKGGSVVLILTGILSFLIQSYMFPMLVLVDLPIKKILINSCILMAVEWKTSLKILLTSGVLILLMCIFMLYLIPLVFVFIFALIQLINCMYLYTVIDKWLVCNKDKNSTVQEN